MTADLPQVPEVNKGDASDYAVTVSSNSDEARHAAGGRERSSIQKHWQAFFAHTHPNNAHIHERHNDHEDRAAHLHVPNKEPMLVVNTDILSLPEMYSRLKDAGKHKVVKPFSQTLVHSILAGFYVGFGATLALYSAGGLGTIRTDYPSIAKLFYASTFPVALILIIILGAELFTGDCILDTVSLLEGDVSVWRYFLSLILSWFGNLIGAMILTQLIKKTNILADPGGIADYIRSIAHKKVHVLTWEEVYVRAIIGNWLVDLAVIMSSGATSYAGKAIGCFVPIFIFAFLGFEHCIANQVMITLGKILGQPLSVRDIVANNLIPATLGNFTGGAVFVALPYFLVYGRVAPKLNTWTSF